MTSTLAGVRSPERPAAIRDYHCAVRCPCRLASPVTPRRRDEPSMDRSEADEVAGRRAARGGVDPCTFTSG